MLKSTLAIAAGVLALGGAAAAPQSADAQALPRNSLGGDCRDVRYEDGRITAQCRDRRGDWRYVSMRTSDCRNGEIRHENGRLICVGGDNGWDRPDRPDRPGNRWGGGWGGRDRITVFSDADYRGQAADFNGEIPNLRNSGLNDRISSIRTNGAWEVCTDAYFRGDCRVFTGDVRNLDWTNFNDKISSLRPARRGW